MEASIQGITQKSASGRSINLILTFVVAESKPSVNLRGLVPAFSGLERPSCSYERRASAPTVAMLQSPPFRARKGIDGSVET
jgi:hypothetical protein